MHPHRGEAVSDSSQQSSPAERVWGLCIAITFGSFFLHFMSGFVFPSDDATTLDYVLLAVFTAWSGLMAAGGIGICLRSMWGEPLLDRLIAVAGVCLFTWMVLSICWAAWRRTTGESPAEPGDGALLILTLLWAGSTTLFLRGWRRQRPRRFEPVLILWPLLLLLLEPVAFGLLLLPIVLFVAGGDLLGSRFGHPYLGASIGLGCAIALFAALALLSRRWV